MSTTTNIGQSIEIARGYLAEHPAEARYTDSVATAVVESGLRCRVEGPNGATLHTDMPGGVGGEGAAPSPGWLARASLAACDATLIVMRAAELGIDLESVEVTVDSESDDRGLLAVDESVPPGPLGIRTRVRITAHGAEPGAITELVEWAERHSPVADALRRSVPSSLQLEINQINEGARS
jgi:uncharacterized OsmC-like protein